MAIPKPNIATAAKAKTTSAAVNAKVLAAAAKDKKFSSEKIAFGLRMNAGIDPARLAGNHDLVIGLREEGLLEDHGPRVRLTPRGRLLADEIAAELI